MRQIRTMPSISRFLFVPNNTLSSFQTCSLIVKLQIVIGGVGPIGNVAAWGKPRVPCGPGYHDIRGKNVFLGETWLESEQSVVDSAGRTNSGADRTSTTGGGADRRVKVKLLNPYDVNLWKPQALGAEEGKGGGASILPAELDQWDARDVMNILQKLSMGGGVRGFLDRVCTIGEQLESDPRQMEMVFTAEVDDVVRRLKLILWIVKDKGFTLEGGGRGGIIGFKESTLKNLFCGFDEELLKALLFDWGKCVATQRWTTENAKSLVSDIRILESELAWLRANTGRGKGKGGGAGGEGDANIDRNRVQEKFLVMLKGLNEICMGEIGCRFVMKPFSPY